MMSGVIFFNCTRLGIDNSQNAAEINAALVALGFGAAELTDGAAKLAAAEGLQADQKEPMAFNRRRRRP